MLSLFMKYGISNFEEMNKLILSTELFPKI